MMRFSAGFYGAGSGNGTDIARQLRRIWTFRTDVVKAEKDRFFDASNMNNNLQILALRDKNGLYSMSILADGGSSNSSSQVVR